MEQTMTFDQKIQDLVKTKRFNELAELLKDQNPADLALTLAALPEEELPLVFRILPKELAADVFVEMDVDDQEVLIRAFSDRELKEVLDELFLDDTVDIIEEMPATVAKRILRQADSKTRKMINQILAYPEDSAGSIMTIEYVDLKKDMTVEDAFARIRKTGVDKETIYTCYVTDRSRKLIGLVTVRTLLLSGYQDKIEDIMETNIIYANTLDDREAVARQFEKYDFLALPVVDGENRLVGIVTVDDAMDVMQEEVTEDIEKMAAILPSDKSYFKTGIFETWKARIPWLLLLMISATFTGMIISSFENALMNSLVLTAFIPMLMDTGGNSGSQSSVTIIRSMSLGDVVFHDILRVIWKELRVALLCGVTLSIASFIKIMLVDVWIMQKAITIPIAFVVCLTLVFSVLFAKLVGCTLPIFAKKLGFDPAVMASPFITTVVDALSLLIYFSISRMVLHI